VSTTPWRVTTPRDNQGMIAPTISRTDARHRRADAPSMKQKGVVNHGSCHRNRQSQWRCLEFSAELCPPERPHLGQQGGIRERNQRFEHSPERLHESWQRTSARADARWLHSRVADDGPE
jgi:hypothetical protein